VRFERDTGQGLEPVFPEVYSFHAARHDPAELLLQLEDLWSNPRLLSPDATRRDAEELLGRLLLALPSYLEGLLDRFEASDPAFYGRLCEDVAVLLEVVRRFVRDKGLEEQTRLRLASFHLSKILLRALVTVMRAHVRPEFLDDYVAGRVEVQDQAAGGPFGAFYALAEGKVTLRPSTPASRPRPSELSIAGWKGSASTRRTWPSKGRDLPSRIGSARCSAR
jgi:hypothetical protein